LRELAHARLIVDKRQIVAQQPVAPCSRERMMAWITVCALSYLVK